jgi:phosphatidylglycerophosphate synthase
MIIANKNIIFIVAFFAIAAITDWFDGKIARAYKLVNPFGAKADMLADRILWVSVALCMLIVFGMRGYLEPVHIMQLIFIMSREIIAAPSTLSYLIFGERIFPSARYIAKVTTFLQGFAFPSLMLSLFYPSWIYISIPLSIAILITGTISGFFYIRDLGKLNAIFSERKK